MDAARQAQVAFYLTGKLPGAELEPVAGLGLKPALLAHYRDLGALRYDYPVVLSDKAEPDGLVSPLSGLVDAALRELSEEEGGQRISKQLLRFETELRRAVAGGARMSLAELWSATAGRLGADADDLLRDSLDRAFAAMEVDGEVADCDAALPTKLLAHVWQAAQARKSRSLGKQLDRLVHRLSNILKADFARSETGRSPESLEASMGGSDAEAFDFDALSRVLTRSADGSALSVARRERLNQLIETLRSFEDPCEALRFESCTEALRAWHARFPALVNVARAIAMAELEIAGDYRDARHDPYFDGYGADGLAPEDLALFGDFLVCVNAATMDAGEQAALMEILSSGLAIKILVQSDDILGGTLPGAGGPGFGRSAPHFANMAVGLNDVYVLQVPSSHLPRCAGKVADGMAYPGAALFSVYSGASPSTGRVPAYLVAAAAAEARAFPIFAYDPGAGADWASRFSLSANPQPEADWPVSGFEYEDAERRRVTRSLEFTLADFAALDTRYAKHLARVPSEHRGDVMIPVSEALGAGQQGQPEKLPGILMVDEKEQLQEVLVDERLLREVRRCREAWHSLQELGGIHNSYAERSLAEARREQEEAAMQTESAPQEAAQPPAETAEAEVAAEPEPASEPSPDEAYIETPRCTTCNECTQINDKMFAYNENRQAYIADPDAGTYAQMVEAAESCQVSIIHPGKPRNPDEPGLEELIKRAEPFL